MKTEDMEDWDMRFMLPVHSLCDNCMPSLLLQEIKTWKEKTSGITGKTGKHYCIKCNGIR